MIQEVTTAHDRDAQKRLKSLPINFAFFLRRSDIDPMPQKSFDDIAFAALRAIGHTCGREVILRNPKTGSAYGSLHPPFNHRKVIEMEPSPLYIRPGKKTNGSHFFRNYGCPSYDQCLNQAAHDDLFLDCTQCSFKDAAMEMFSLYLKNSGIE